MHRVVVRLEHDRPVAMGVIGWQHAIVGRAFDGEIVLDQDAIEEDGDACRLRQGAVVIETRRVIDDVITLPVGRGRDGARS